MKKTLLTILATIVISTSAMADQRQATVDSVATIPGILMSAWVGQEYMVFFTNPYAGHNTEQLGKTICQGSGVDKGYAITFWNPRNKTQISRSFWCGA